MRIATGIIALILMCFVGLQSCAVSFGGALIDDNELAGSGAVGMLVAFGFMLGGAFVFKLPKVSMVIFILSGLLALIAGASEFSDMKFWAVVCFILALMSYFGGRKPKHKDPNVSA